MHVIRRLTLGVLVAAVLAACGAHSRGLSDGQYYGKLVSVDIAHRRLNFAPACNLNASGRWATVATSSRTPITLDIAAHPDLEIYLRPSGNVATGHVQGADLRQLADVAAHGRLPDFPPGWFLTVRNSTAVSVAEDSGIRSSGNADKRTFACVWSDRTQTFVRP
jgi:hypothetical protein